MKDIDTPVVSAGLGAMAGFQAALALGAPWGRASYGGAHPGALPANLRVASAAASLVYAGLAYAVAAPSVPISTRRGMLTAVAALSGMGTAANAMSRSTPERALWTPVTAATALAAWRARARVAVG